MGSESLSPGPLPLWEWHHIIPHKISFILIFLLIERTHGDVFPLSHVRKPLFIPFFIFIFSFSVRKQLKMSQNPDKPHSSEEKSSGLEDGQESLDNPDQSIRKRIRQSAPGSYRDDTPKCKQNCLKKYTILYFFQRRQSWFFIVFRVSLTA